ncbi:Bug family tripartite tricarboxylate transporter substrate binding protein [Parapusillimonas granuli]|uniref:Tripartite tricarboxylate transporter substrate binding protein n=1 Tax=Parapusillimonas granuli TaxID=380911 RepID=A0A853FT89_9BURK|nr:tripartite tricarboxylate transporter substrate binding protein [Parapusillimonas granuli]MBB5214467.1 tripartite-type tricarboxylate transporter receptor subunit TctC [Parapusillimonas granuli]NYT49124.1 tripartite tricarboxylate transporter substrate binding protein [Parapusillimonas granuli]
MRSYVVSFLASLMLTPALHAETAQNYPSRPITIVVPFAAGGSTDALARALSNHLGNKLGQSVVVENKPGAAGAIGAANVASAPADGYKLLVATSSTHSILPLLRELPYDSIKDFTPVAGLGVAPNVLVVSPTLNVSSVAELIALAKKDPGALTFSSSGTGTITHLIGEQFLQRAGIEAAHIPYKTGVQALGDITTGRVSFAFDSVVWTLPQSQNGKVKALALTSKERSALAPSLPTMSESGLPNFDAATWFGIMAPSGTPPSVVDKLNTAINDVLKDPAMLDQLRQVGAVPLGGSPETLGRLAGDEMQQWKPVISQLKIKVE